MSSDMFPPICQKAGGHIGRNVVEITIKMKTIVRKLLMIKISLCGNKKTELFEIELFDHLTVCVNK